MNKIHIVHILPELNQGGVETIVLSLNRELVKRGHQSSVVSNGGTLCKEIEKDGGRHITVNVCSKNPVTALSRAFKLRSVLSRIRPDVIHVHSRVPAWLAWIANKRLKLPWVTTVHGFNSIGKFSEIMTRGDRVICVSNPVKDYILQNYRVDPSKIHTIHCGIALDQFNPEKLSSQQMESLEQELGVSGKFVITSVGRITELKDYETYIRAIALAHRNRPDICALIVGNVRSDKQGYYERLKQLVLELNMDDHIRFINQCDTMPELYALSSIVVSCSKKPESFGLTLIEALAMNTPVIATRHGGPLDIIKEGDNGYFFEAGQVQELADLLADTPPLSKEHNLRDVVIERFSIANMTEMTLNTYCEAIGNA